ncbi:MAG: hypothetical protein FWD23_07025 [Oscillospiraceae bacterium]|nr:hypothetical protein [Oscillospiraceae bacterium]
MKKIKIVALIFSFVFCLILFPATASDNRDYTAPILAIAYDLVEGLSEEEAGEALDHANRDAKDLTETEILERIYHNYVNSIDENKYGGAHFDKEKKELNLYITDKKVQVKIDDANVVFHIVKYSYRELENFSAVLFENFEYPQISGSDIKVRENKVKFYISDDFDADVIKKYVPEDAYYYERKDVSSWTG